ncbi:MAG: DUF1648 domain-containing protein [Ruminiclostridium sp.]|nr:DUF1648 domain-containing protein [Ruminiclostridium sp.]
MGITYRKVSLFIFILMVILGVCCLFTLPGEIAVHWNAFGEADGYMSKYTAVAVSTGACAICLWAWSIMRTKYEVWFAWKQSLRMVSDGMWAVFSCLGIFVEIVFFVMN